MALSVVLGLAIYSSGSCRVILCMEVVLAAMLWLASEVMMGLI